MIFWRKKKTPEEIVEEQRKKEELERAELISAEAERSLEEKLSNIDRFQGNLQEYIFLKKEEGYLTGNEKVVPMSTERVVKWVMDPIYSDKVTIKKGGVEITLDGERELLSKLIDGGCVGLIRYQRTYNSQASGSGVRCLGTPVKIKKLDEPYR